MTGCSVGGSPPVCKRDLLPDQHNLPQHCNVVKQLHQMRVHRFAFTLVPVLVFRREPCCCLHVCSSCSDATLGSISRAHSSRACAKLVVAEATTSAVGFWRSTLRTLGVLISLNQWQDFPSGFCSVPVNSGQSGRWSHSRHVAPGIGMSGHVRRRRLWHKEEKAPSPQPSPGGRGE
jgi:hypothetical protein